MVEISSAVLFEDEEIIDVTCTSHQNFILYRNHSIKIIEQFTNKESIIHLMQKEDEPTLIYADDEWLYCGNSNGTTEIWSIDPLEFVHLTSEEDAGGPGEPNVEQFYSTGDYLFVNTLENGTLIYLKPDFKFYKWIMIGGFTTIIQMSYANERLYVLTDDNQIHILDFSVSRLIPLEINIGKIVDLGFNGRYLFIATQKKCRIYNPNRDYELASGFNLSISIDGGFWLDNYLFLIDQDMVVHILDERLDFSVVNSIRLDYKIPIHDLKYSIYKSSESKKFHLRCLSCGDGKVIETRIII
jgi:hypothetical protein